VSPLAASTTLSFRLSVPSIASQLVAARVASLAALGLCLFTPLLQAAPAAATTAAAPTILVVGDSLSAAYGIRVEQGWVTLLQQRLRSQGYGHRVVNASSSGETTGGALARLPRALQLHRPAVVVVELGGNDGLRGLPVAEVRANFERIVALSRAAGARVLLLGMRIPPNYGPRYTREFEALYGELAQRLSLPLLPFFLDGIALDDQLMQNDGIHPTAAAQPRLLEAVWPVLEPLLGRPR
jgi:acyl-CoA thioesterase-1